MVADKPNEASRPVLDYGRAEPLRRRVMQRIPRLGRWTLAAVAVAGLCGVWLSMDHEVWACGGRYSSTLGAVLSPNGKHLVTFTPKPDASPVLKQGTLTVWDWRAGREVYRVEFEREVKRARYSPNGRRLLLSTEQGCYLHDALSGRLIAHVERKGEWCIPGISSSIPRFCTEFDGLVELWDSETGTAVATVHRGEEVGDVRFSASGQYVFVAGNWDGPRWRAFRATDGTEVPVPADRELLPCWVSPDGRFALQHHGALNYLLMWQFPDGQAVGSLACRWPACIWSPDSRRVLVTAPSQAPVLWEVDTGQVKPLPLPPVIYSDYDRCFSPDSSLLVSRYQSTIQILKLPSLECVARMPGYDGEGLVFSQDGRFLLYSSTGDRIHLWDVRANRWAGRLPRGVIWAAMPDERTAIFKEGEDDSIAVYHPRRPAAWYGWGWLAQFWLAVGTGGWAVWRVGRDVRAWYRPRVNA